MLPRIDRIELERLSTPSVVRALSGEGWPRVDRSHLPLPQRHSDQSDIASNARCLFQPRRFGLGSLRAAFLDLGVWRRGDRQFRLPWPYVLVRLHPVSIDWLVGAIASRAAADAAVAIAPIAQIWLVVLLRRQRYI